MIDLDSDDEAELDRRHAAAAEALHGGVEVVVRVESGVQLRVFKQHIGSGSR